MSRPEDKIAIIKELQSRRATLSPDKVAILDELSSRYGLVESTGPFGATAPDFSKSAMGVAGEQALDVARGVRDFIPGLISTAAHGIYKTLSGEGAQLVPELAQGIKSGVIDPLATIGKGAVEIGAQYPGIQRRPAEWLASKIGPAPPPQAPEWSAAAQFSGANFAGSVAPKIPVTKLTRGAMNLMTTPEKLEARAAANVARALGPKGPEAKAAAQKIAPELSEQKAIQGIRQKTIDANLKADMHQAGQQAQMMEDYVIDNKIGQPVKRAELLQEIDDAIAALHVKGTDVVYATDALKELAQQRAKLLRYPEEVPFETIIDARRKLDSVVDKSGGFKLGMSPKEGTKLIVQRSVADMFRRKVNSFHTALEEANHQYWLKRKAVDIAEGRELSEVGSVGAELPGRGTLLDDMIASGLGAMMGGKAGAVIGEAINIGRQFPGFSGLKARFQQSAADFMRRQAPEFTGTTAEFVDDIPSGATATGSGPKFPSKPRVGDRFTFNGRLFTFTRDGWKENAYLYRSQRALPKAPEPPK